MPLLSLDSRLCFTHWTSVALPSHTSPEHCGDEAEKDTLSPRADTVETLEGFWDFPRLKMYLL